MLATLHVELDIIAQMLRPKLHVLPGPTIRTNSKVLLLLVGHPTEDTTVHPPLELLKFLAPPECGNQTPERLGVMLALLGITARPPGRLVRQAVQRGTIVQLRVQFRFLALSESGRRTPSEIHATLAQLDITARPMAPLIHQAVLRGTIVQLKVQFRLLAPRSNIGGRFVVAHFTTVRRLHLDWRKLFYKVQQPRIDFSVRVPTMLADVDPSIKKPYS